MKSNLWQIVYLVSWYFYTGILYLGKFILYICFPQPLISVIPTQQKHVCSETCYKTVVTCPVRVVSQKTVHHFSDYDKKLIPIPRSLSLGLAPSTCFLSMPSSTYDSNLSVFHFGVSARLQSWQFTLYSCFKVGMFFSRIYHFAGLCSMCSKEYCWSILQSSLFQSAQKGTSRFSYFQKTAQMYASLQTLKCIQETAFTVSDPTELIPLA